MSARKSAGTGLRWLVIGAGGMLGQDMVAVLEAAGEDVKGVRRPEVDVTEPGTLEARVPGHDVVVNCSAWTAVDDAEIQEPAAFAINAVGAANVARAASAASARLVHVSTDYVFDGGASTPYAEDAAVAPRSAYGRTKAAGEWAVRAEAPDHLVVRTAWLYGARGPSFPRTMARLAAERDELTVVDDQIGQPTWTVDLAELVHRLVVAGAPAGTYHGTASGSTSWFGFARAVVATTGRDVAVRPTTSANFVRPAPRPAYSVLGHDALAAAGVEPIGDWEERWSCASGVVLGGASSTTGAGRS